MSHFAPYSLAPTPRCLAGGAGTLRPAHRAAALHLLLAVLLSTFARLLPALARRAPAPSALPLHALPHDARASLRPACILYAAALRATLVPDYHAGAEPWPGCPPTREQMALVRILYVLGPRPNRGMCLHVPSLRADRCRVPVSEIFKNGSLGSYRLTPILFRYRKYLGIASASHQSGTLPNITQ